jgi:hypothetical protein
MPFIFLKLYKLKNMVKLTAKVNNWKALIYFTT